MVQLGQQLQRPMRTAMTTPVATRTSGTWRQKKTRGPRRRRSGGEQWQAQLGPELGSDRRALDENRAEVEEEEEASEGAEEA